MGGKGERKKEKNQITSGFGKIRIVVYINRKQADSRGSPRSAMLSARLSPSRCWSF